MFALSRMEDIKSQVASSHTESPGPLPHLDCWLRPASKPSSRNPHRVSPQSKSHSCTFYICTYIKAVILIGARWQERNDWMAAPSWDRSVWCEELILSHHWPTMYAELVEKQEDNPSPHLTQCTLLRQISPTWRTWSKQVCNSGIQVYFGPSSHMKLI